MQDRQHYKLQPLIIRNIALLAAASVVGVTAFQTLFLLAPLALLRLTGSEFISSNYMTFFAGGTLIALIPAGTLMDRFGRRVGLLAGPAIILTGLMLSSLSVAYASTPALLASIMFCGMGVGFTNLNTMAGGDIAPPGRKAEIMAIVSFCSSFGLFSGPLLGGFAADTAQSLGLDPLVASWWFPAALAAAAILFGGLIRPDPKKIAQDPAKYHGFAEEAEKPIPDKHESPQAAKAGGLREMLPLLKDRPMQTVLVASFGFTILRTSILVLLATVLYKRGFSMTLTGTMISAMGLGGLISGLPAGFVADRLGRKAVLVVACLLALLGLPMVFLKTGSLLLWSGLVLLGMAFAAVQGMDRAILVDITEAATRGKAFGIWQFSDNSARMATPLLAGAINVMAKWEGVGVLCFVSVAIAMFFVVRLREAAVGVYARPAGFVQ